MSSEENQPIDLPPSGPAVVTPPSRTTRLLTSWKLWTMALVLAFVAIGVALTLPIVARLRALRYFDRNGGRVAYQLSDDDAELTEDYGEWGTALRKLDRITVYDANDEAMGHVGMFREARSLVVISDEEQPITENGGTAIVGFNQLHRLDLTGRGFSDRVLAELLADGLPLDEVHLIDTSAGVSTFTELARYGAITVFSAMGPHLDDGEYTLLAPMPHLEYFKGSGLGDRGVEWLLQSPHLAIAVLSRSHITDAGLRRLCEATDIGSLWIDGAPITGEGLKALVELENLDALSLIHCPHLTGTDLAQLADLHHLRTLDVTADLVDSVGEARINELRRRVSLQIHGEIADPRIRAALQSIVSLDEAPPTTETEYWRWIRDRMLPW